MSGLVKAIFRPIASVFSSFFGGGDDDRPSYNPPPALPPPAPIIAAPVVPKDVDTKVAEEDERRRVGAMKGKSSTLQTAGGWAGLGEVTEDELGGQKRKKMLG